ncbi:MAG: hypothetical protein CVU44_02460 [Chloroflexi bacterium HGW-Chloroflexi-6]|nr:MAG: hypothetical protein CVU44_02460 [Chloroflexi bacterium HGW-Chloroflexi-6]
MMQQYSLPQDFKILIREKKLEIIRGVLNLSNDQIDKYIKKEKHHRFSLVVAFQNKKFLMLRNNYRDLGWELPGGSVDNGETYEEAARRELLEEAGFFTAKVFPICAILAQVNSPKKTLYSFGIAFATLSFVDTGKTELQTKEKEFFLIQPDKTMFVNHKVINIAIKKIIDLSCLQ